MKILSTALVFLCSASAMAQVNQCPPSLDQLSDTMVLTMAETGKLGDCTVVHYSSGWDIFVNRTAPTLGADLTAPAAAAFLRQLVAAGACQK